MAIACGARQIDAVTLRYQNVYGPGQSLTNPYTGIISIFYSLITESKPVPLFEDGLPSRDFVFVDDVAAATVAALESRLDGSSTINVGSGVRTSVRAVAETLYAVLGMAPRADVCEQYRVGDIRHCYADVTRLREQLDFSPRVDFPEGIRRFVAWAETRRDDAGQAAERFARAQRELVARKLFR